jgi:hypothetical protein
MTSGVEWRVLKHSSSPITPTCDQDLESLDACARPWATCDQIKINRIAIALPCGATTRAERDIACLHPRPRVVLSHNKTVRSFAMGASVGLYFSTVRHLAFSGQDQFDE